jgi:hypothetical protein
MNKEARNRQSLSAEERQRIDEGINFVLHQITNVKTLKGIIATLKTKYEKADNITRGHMMDLGGDQENNCEEAKNN